MSKIRKLNKTTELRKCKKSTTYFIKKYVRVEGKSIILTDKDKELLKNRRDGKFYISRGRRIR